VKAEQVQRVAALRAVPGLAALGTDEIAALAASAEERFFSRGARLTQRGAAVGAVHVILDGTLRAGERRLAARDVVGALEVLAAVPAADDAVAESDVLALALRRGEVLDFLEESFAATHGVLRALASETLKRLMARPEEPWPGHQAAPPPAPAGAMALADKLVQLHGSILFGRTRLEALADLARVAVEERRERGAMLWRGGERSGHGYIVVAGGIECRVPGHAARTMGPGCGAGVLESLAGAPRWFEARAAGDLVALRIEMGDTLDIIEDHMDLAHDILRGLAAGLLALRRNG
jgi:CRP-like cAMP-binding protein